MSFGSWRSARSVSSVLLSDNYTTLSAGSSERSPELCDPAASTSPSPRSPPSAATRRCARTSWTSSRAAAGRRAVRLLAARSCTRWPPSCAPARPSSFTPASPDRRVPARATRIRDRVLALRAQDRSVTEIAAGADRRRHARFGADGVEHPCRPRGWSGLQRRAPSERGAPPPRLQPVKARAIPHWPAGITLPCDHAGLFLLVPGIVELGPARPRSRPVTTRPPRCSRRGTRSGGCCWPSARARRALPHRRARRRRRARAAARADRAAEGHPPDQLLLPRAASLQRAAARRRHPSPPGARARHGEEGFNLDFHAIRHHGADTPLEKHYVPRRSQRTRAVLTFFAQDHASTEMVYANADLTKAEQAREMIAFADYWQQVAGTDPGLLVFDSKLTTYKVLYELTARGIRWMTLRERGPKLIADLAALPTLRLENRPDRPHRPLPHPRSTTSSSRSRTSTARPPARRAQHRPRAAHAPDHQRIELTTKQLFARYAERMTHRERTRRLHPRLPPRRALLRPTAQRRPRHHPDRHRRQPLPAPRPPTPPLRERAPPTALAPLPRHHRHPPPHRRPAHRRAPRPHLPPRPDRRRPRRPPTPIPWLDDRELTIPLPTPLNLSKSF